ncbi:long-chain acyl-CoA synthetase [Rhizobiales bacterium GAS191]|nr:long-chain acyl-CoA synthetase [Rhizobiales bacterium GAS113]SEC13346.1 long-chain acyl-CoA synthetase [Rhizobiales bacterium GAS191]
MAEDPRGAAAPSASTVSMASRTYRDRPWLALYPPGVPAAIDVAKLGTIVDLLQDSVRAYAERPAYTSFGSNLSFAEVGRYAGAFSAWLRAQGVEKGDRVALMMPNIFAYPVAMFGVHLAGAAVVNVNPLYTAGELANQVNDSGARLIVVLENVAHTVAEALPRLKVDKVVIATVGDLMGFKGTLINLVSRYVKKIIPPFEIEHAVSFATALDLGSTLPKPTVTVTGDDVAFLQYTGGTTGVSKGAVLLHRNICANLEQIYTWFWPDTDHTAWQVVIAALPLYHVYALTCNALYMMRIGGSCVLIANPRDIKAFVATLRKTRFSIITGVNTLYNALVQAPDIDKVDFSNLGTSNAGGMAVQEAVAKKWQALTGSIISEGYGLSETSPVVTANPVRPETFSGTIGVPVPSTEVTLRAPETGEEVPVGAPGELCVRGPQVMRGYWQAPEATAAAFYPDGFFRTGDVALMLPDGQFKIVDRIKDMISVSGLKVTPNEVEGVISSHPDVIEVAAIGLPDQHSGEAVTAYVVSRSLNLTEDVVRAWCRERLAAYKVPRHVVFRDTLPKTNVGKVLRRALRDEALAAAASGTQRRAG